MNRTLFTRRQVLATGLAGLAGGALSPWIELLHAGSEEPRFKISACDWSIGRRQQLDALVLAKKIGLDGVQVSFGDVEARYDLRKADVRQEFAAASKRLGVEISSLAMGVLNRVPYASAPRAEQWVRECVEVMGTMGQKVVLLAFFGRGNIKNKPNLQKEVIRRLKKVAPLAEKNRVVLGLETWLSAEEHMRILDAVGSPAVKVYYDLANSNKMGYDIYKEIRWLGRENICEFHCKENGFLLGHGRIDFHKFRDAVNEIGYRGWLVIEGARETGLSLMDCYLHNRRYLRAVFSR